MEENKKQPLTLEDLGKFTEDVLLPAVDNMIDRKLDEKIDGKLSDTLDKKFDEKFDGKLNSILDKKFDEKLNPIKQDLSSIKEGLKRIGEKLDKYILIRSRKIQKAGL